MTSETQIPSIQLRDYLSALSRRRQLLLSVSVTILMVSLLLALLLPAVYRSEAVILIEQQEIPSDFVRSTVTSFADQRIQVIGQTVMTSRNLIGIIEKFDLYVDERQREPIQIVVEKMRDDIDQETISADVVDPRSGRPTQATIAFRISYESPAPATAQKVANELVSLFLNENIKSRTKAAAETSEFLTDEAEGLRQRVAGFEARLAQFKRDHPQNRPELEGITREIISRAEMRHLEIEQRQHSAEQQLIYFEAELIKIEPYLAAASPTELAALQRLMDAESQLVAAEAGYGDSHPDVKRLHKQVDALRLQVDPAKAKDLYEKQLVLKSQDLAALVDTYGENYPDVQKARRVVDNLRTLLESIPNLDPGEPDNPAYISIRSQIERLRAEIRTLSETRRALQSRIDRHTGYLLSIPDVEAEYRALQREHENALQKYQEITAKQMEARVSENLEIDNKGERFVLIEPPIHPERPSKPNRIALMLVGTLLAMTAGLGSVGIAEAMDTRVRGRRGIQNLLTAPPLAIIPSIRDEGMRTHRYRSMSIATGIAVVVIAAALVTVHTTVKPLDVLWFVLLRKIGI